MLMLGRKPVSPLCMPYAGIEKATNCILEIPQNIKLTLENNVLTLKSGSTVVDGRSVYTTVTTMEDKNYTISDSLSSGRYLVSVRVSDWAFIVVRNDRCVSGETDSLAELAENHIWLDTTAKEVNMVFREGGKAIRSYPFCVIDIVNGVASFAKDSNNNDMIFNGMGFIGHHAFVYPNVKALIPDGFNDDGSYKTIEVTTNSLQIRELSFNRIDAIIGITSTATLNLHRKYYSVKDINDIDTNQSWSVWYVSNQNILYLVDDNKSISTLLETLLIKYSSSISLITNFTIQQPLTKYKWVVKLIP